MKPFNKLDEIAESSKNFDTIVRKATLRLCLAYWACMFVADSILSYFININPIESAPFRLIGFTADAMITYAMALLLARMRNLTFTHKALLSVLMTAVVAPVFCVIDFLCYMLCQYPNTAKFDPTYSGYILIESASILFGWSCLFIALLYNFEVRDRERSLAIAREEALTMQMRALRYQVNPHFLFNTLNSIAGLIEEGAATRAERMVLSLSTFMRTTLSLDPMHDVPLADELALQEEYLAIEHERFSDRMTFSIDVPLEARAALVPSLILQPLIENAIKHGVGVTIGKVEIALKAYREGNRLYISVENDMPPNKTEKSHQQGMGVGLQNVAERLNARFKGSSQFSSGLVCANRYRASINIPWSIA